MVTSSDTSGAALYPGTCYPIAGEPGPEPEPSREPRPECALTAAAEFEHLCCEDLYRGRLLVLGPRRFV